MLAGTSAAMVLSQGILITRSDSKRRASRNGERRGERRDGRTRRRVRSSTVAKPCASCVGGLATPQSRHVTHCPLGPSWLGADSDCSAIAFRQKRMVVVVVVVLDPEVSELN